VFLLGPSHHLYLTGCALSQCDFYETPLGNLKLDSSTIAELHKTGKFDKMSKSTDEDEHSLEMHLPYIYKAISKAFDSTDQYPSLVPILVGSTNAAREASYGEVLKPYIQDPDNVFVVSSDFCHWGSRFSYTYYVPSKTSMATEGYTLRSRDVKDIQIPIHESIGRLDELSIEAIATGNHNSFIRNLEQSGNTVCGRHPIGVIMSALEQIRKELSDTHADYGKFKFIRYERSSDAERYQDSSVSYASAYAIF
jgi:AmmeMemoRadiSam system protein B